MYKATPPDEFPVEQMMRYELVVNPNTAKALGIRLPSSILLRSDEVNQ